MAISNSIDLGVVEEPPLQETGWEIRVLSKDSFNLTRPLGTTSNPLKWGPPLAVLPAFISAIISPTLSQTGTGSVTLDLDSPFWHSTLSDGTLATNLLEYEHIWQVFEGEALRFEFLGQQVDETFVEDSETRAVTISGPGPAEVLKWALVMTPGYPHPPDDSDTKHLKATVHFANDKSFLDEAAKKVLNKVIADLYSSDPLTTDAENVIETYTLYVTKIVGHTDSNASVSYNYDLGMRRAKAVKEYILTKVPKAKIAISSKGERQPVASNGTAKGRAKNRRAEISYTIEKPKDNYFPTYMFKKVPAMNAWLTLLNDAKKRGTIKFVRPTFTTTRDSSKILWDDTPNTNQIGSDAITTVEADVLFATGSFALSAAAVAKLKGIIPHVRTVPKGRTGYTTRPEIKVVGHTDNVGSHPDNLALSLKRGRAVAIQIAKLMEADKRYDTKAGYKISESKKRITSSKYLIEWTGAGETQPVADNKTVAGRKKNRRVTVGYPGYATLVDDLYYEPQLGQNLFDLLNEWTGREPGNFAPMRGEWYMHPGFRLDVKRVGGIGHPLWNQVVFYEGSTTMSSEALSRSRENIKNLIAIRNGYGRYFIQSDKTSISRWLQREYFEQIDGDFADAALSKIASAAKETNKDEISSWTVSVPAYATGRRVFFDYNIGDWIGVSRYNEIGGLNKIEKFRVMAISLKVDQQGLVDTVELTLQNVYQSKVEFLQQQITSIKNHVRNGPRVYFGNMAPWGAKPGDLWTPPKSVKTQ